MGSIHFLNLEFYLFLVQIYCIPKRQFLSFCWELHNSVGLTLYPLAREGCMVCGGRYENIYLAVILGELFCFPNGLEIISSLSCCLSSKTQLCLSFGLDLGFPPMAFTMGPLTQSHRNPWLELIFHPYRACGNFLELTHAPREPRQAWEILMGGTNLRFFSV